MDEIEVRNPIFSLALNSPTPMGSARGGGEQTSYIVGFKSGIFASLDKIEYDTIAYITRI